MAHRLLALFYYMSHFPLLINTFFQRTNWYTKHVNIYDSYLSNKFLYKLLVLQQNLWLLNIMKCSPVMLKFYVWYVSFENVTSQTYKLTEDIIFLHPPWFVLLEQATTFLWTNWQKVLTKLKQYYKIWCEMKKYFLLYFTIKLWIDSRYHHIFNPRCIRVGCIT